MQVRRQHVTDAGLSFIAGWEGFRAAPYNDAGGNATIGYGHLLHYGPVNARDVEQNPTLTRAGALELLRDDVDQAEETVRELVRPPFVFPWRFDAITSFVYNVGAGAFARSGVLRQLNASRTRGRAADELLAWDHAGGRELPGLLNRRRAERALFLFRRYL